MVEANTPKMFPISVPKDAIIGLNYSGMHDTSLAVISPNGMPLYAVSLERLTRIKQDGRSPKKLFEGMPWEKVSKVAISVAHSFNPPENLNNKYHPIELDKKRYYDRSHGKKFMEQLDFIPVEKIFVPHHLAHAASAYWMSGFSDATCLVYDGGMSNEEWFGGIFNATIDEGVRADQLFSATCYANITQIYTAVTALLGFKPLKHEGKVTGLAANGKPTKKCRNILEKWLHEPASLDGLLVWEDMYQDVSVPQLTAVPGVIEVLKEQIKSFSDVELAATVQAVSEEHVNKILEAIKQNKDSNNLCLSGGLFANVKINQRASEAGFDKTFISPPMSDDGTALGAALHIAASNNSNISPKPIENVYLGPRFSPKEVQSTIRNSGSKITKTKNIPLEVAQLLNEGAIVAVFNGSMEFGPRGLGNRSILAKADNYDINRKLNELLHRTEFMPFAPICCEEDAQLLFKGIEKVKQAAHFMTVTLDCTKKMSDLHPAVVHVDGTARPQLVSSKSNILIYKILTNYKALSGRFALVNTSFNIHEEPIIMTPDDALKGFYESGIDAILLNNTLIKLSDNPLVELSYVRNKLNIAISSIERKKEEIYVHLVKAYQANELSNKALALAEQAEAKTKEVEANTAQANELSDKVQALAEQAKTRANQAEIDTQNAWKAYQTIIYSRSWRMTAPLRWTMNGIKWFLRGSVAWLTLRPGSRPNRSAKLVLLHLHNWVMLQPQLKNRLKPLLLNFPSTRKYLQSVLDGMSLEQLSQLSLDKNSLIRFKDNINSIKNVNTSKFLPKHISDWWVQHNISQEPPDFWETYDQNQSNQEGKTHVLQLTTYNIDKPDHGGKIRCYQIRKKLREIYNVQTLSFEWGNALDVSTNSVVLDNSFLAKNALNGNLADIAIAKYIDEDDYLYKILGRRVKIFAPKLIFLEQPFLFSLIKRFKSDGFIPSETRLIYSSHNIEVEIKREIYNSLFDHDANSFNRYITQINYIEKNAIKACDAAIACTTEDSHYISKQNHGVPIKTFNNGSLMPAISNLHQQKWTKRFNNNCVNWVFVGSWHQPNITGLETLVKSLEKIEGRDFALWVLGSAGYGLKEIFEKNKPTKNHPWLHIMGPVEAEDIDTAILCSSGVVLPIQDGGGSNLKTAQALLSKKCIIATEKSFRSFEHYHHEPGVFVVELIEEIAVQMTETKPKHHYNRSQTLSTLEWSSILQDLPEFAEQILSCDS